MNQAEVSILISQLKTKVNPHLRKLRNSEGPLGRLKKLRKTVTALVKHERIELNYQRADESRMYAERLISDAIRYGDCHKTTMDMATFWLEEKQLIHKLFKVLAPRFKDSPISFTKLYRAPRVYPGLNKPKAVLELRGNPFPPLVPDLSINRKLIHNVLLDEVKREYRQQKYAEIAVKIDLAEREALAELEKKVNMEASQSEQQTDKLVENLENVKLDNPTKDETSTSSGGNPEK